MIEDKIIKKITKIYIDYCNALSNDIITIEQPSTTKYITPPDIQKALSKPFHLNENLWTLSIMNDTLRNHKLIKRKKHLSNYDYIIRFQAHMIIINSNKETIEIDPLPQYEYGRYY